MKFPAIPKPAHESSYCSFWGDPTLNSGTYLLHIRVHEDLHVAYGRYQQGRPILTPAGQYLYIGSALGQKGPASLPWRLLRHASRAAGPPHAIQQYLRAEFSLRPPTGKRMHWHIDYLLEETAVSLHHITLIRSQVRLENQIARILMARPAFVPLAPGLGATDDPGLTHILRVAGLTIPQIQAILPIFS